MRGALGCIVSLYVVFCILGVAYTDLPCIGRDTGIEGRSIVCVCNSTYCDTVSREQPAPGGYVVYTTTRSGLRFAKSYGEILTGDEVNYEEDEDSDDIVEQSGRTNATLRLFVSRRFQFIEGFGGSVTDAASINWRSLSDGAQTNLINTYFSRDGIEYNMIRVPIAGCDFSTHPYTYNEEPWYDHALSNYTLSDEDHFLKLPMLKRSQRVATDEIYVTASAWSPPVWMKTNERITGFAQVKPEYYQAYADYHMRFIEEYEKAEVPIWAITTSNEPLNGILPVVDFNSIGFTPGQMARFVANNLGPTLKNSRYNKTKILAVDDQRYMVPLYVAGIQLSEPRAFDYIDGFAIHYYGNFVPAQLLRAVHDQFPSKTMISTEACEGPMPWHSARVVIGSWERGRKYAKFILQDLNNMVSGWIDWNLCLDPQGGPNWVSNFVDAPVMVYADRDEFIKQPMFYALGHFSKFIPRGSRRIRSARRSLLSVENVAFIKPDGNLVMVLQNPRTRDINVRIRIDSTRFISLYMEAQSIKTIEINR